MTRWLALALLVLAALPAGAAAVRAGPARTTPKREPGTALTEPARTEPARTEPAATEPRSTELAATGLAPAVSEPAPAELIPAMPWPPPAAVWGPPVAASPISRPTHFPRAQPSASAPKRVEDPEHAKTREHPATEVVGSRWYEPECRIPDRLYLERLLAGEVVEGWAWDAGCVAADGIDWREATDVESLSFCLDGRMQRTTTKNSDGDYIEAPMVGPSMRWHPTQRTQFDFSQMVGVASPYPMSEVCVAYGYRF